MLLFSSKGNNKYKALFLCLGLIFLILSFIFAVSLAPSRYASDSEKMIHIMVCCAIGGFGIFAVIFAFVNCNGYIDIYSDHIEGKGLQGKGMNFFYLNKYQVKSVTQQSYYLCLHTEAGLFKIICDKTSRNKIMSILLQKNNL